MNGLESPLYRLPRCAGENIQATMRLGITLLMALGIMGCVHHPIVSLSGKQSPLQHWIDEELAPYLVQQMGEHPRFKGEPIILVQLESHDVQPSIDGLTRTVRDQLLDDLLTKPGTTLSWQPQRPPLQHHRSLDRVQCTRIRDASYFIGIEISRGSNSEHRVSVRALDVRAGEWVSGFGKQWTGRLSAGEEAALNRREVDESLRGLRVLPFSGANPDLAAAYLANNLSCLLRQRDTDLLTIYVEPLRSPQPQLRTLLKLISHNLSRYREVRITDRKKDASYLLRGEAYEVHTGLHQVWVLLQPNGSGERLSGMDTATWVETSSRTRTPTSQALPAPIATPEPRISALELVNRNTRGQRCINTTQGRTPSSNCRALQVSVENYDGIFVFVHDTKDGVSRLSSERCTDSDSKPRGLPGALHYSYPASRFAQKGWATVYAVAVSGPQLAKAFEKHLQQLPDACGPAPGLRSEVAIQPWLNDLDRLASGNGERLAWTARRMQ